MMLLLLNLNVFAETLPVHAAEITQDEPSSPTVNNGWVQENNNWYFYKAGKLLKNQICGNSSGGYYYVDEEGIRVDDPNMNQAVQSIRKYTKPGYSKAKKLDVCWRKIVKTCRFKNIGDVTKVKASDMPGYTKRFFKKKSGNCYCHAATLGYMAKALGYKKIRVVRGRLTRKYANEYLYSDHGWLQIKKGDKWYIYDLTMIRRWPKRPFVNVTKKKYYKVFSLTPKKNFYLKTSAGEVIWK